MLNALMMTASLLGQDAAAQGMMASTEPVELRASREGGQNVFRAGPWSGTFTAGGMNTNIMGIRSLDRVRNAFTLDGPGFEDGPLEVECAGRESSLTIIITWQRERLSYACTFSRNGEPIEGSGFALAFSRSGGFRGVGRTERAGEITYAGRTLHFETHRLSGGIGLPTGRVPGYMIRTVNGEPVGGMDYRAMRPLLHVPHAGDENRQTAMLAALILAMFMDPANTSN